MKPDQFKAAAVRIFGRKKWQVHLAAHLGCDVSTIHRMMKREQVAGPYEVAIAGMLEQRKREIELERAARKLLPRKLRRKKNAKAVRAPKRLPVGEKPQPQ
jgi:hypothetical protein